MLITTTPTIEGAQIRKYLGIVSGTESYSVGGLLTGSLLSQGLLYTTAHKTAIKMMQGIAEKLGANAIVGVSVNCTSPGGLNHVIVIVTGTAVIVDDSALSDNLSRTLTSQNTDKLPVTVTSQSIPGAVTRTVPPAPGSWNCKHCGTSNSANYGQCKRCGKFRSS